MGTGVGIGGTEPRVRGTESRVGGAGPSPSLSLSLPSRGISCAEAARSMASSAARSAASARPAAISPHGPGAEAGAGPLRRRGRRFLLHLAPGGAGRAGQVKSLPFLPAGSARPRPGAASVPAPVPARWGGAGLAGRRRCGSFAERCYSCLKRFPLPIPDMIYTYQKGFELSVSKFPSPPRPLACRSISELQSLKGA